MKKQDLYALCTLIPPMDDYSGHNMYLCGKRDGFNECVQTLKENLESISEEQGHESWSVPKVDRRTRIKLYKCLRTSVSAFWRDIKKSRRLIPTAYSMRSNTFF